MTENNPYDGNSPNDESGGAFQRLPQYPATPHPEDSANYGYANYADPTVSSPVPMKQGTGHINVMEAVSWGMKAALRSWVFWVSAIFVLIVAILIPMIGILTISAQAVAVGVSGAVTMVIALVSQAVLVTQSVRQVDQHTVSWGQAFKGINWGPFIVTNIVLVVINAVILLLVLAIAVSLGMNAPTFVDPALTEDELVNASVTNLLSTLFFELVSLLIYPFFMSATCAAADGNSVGNSLRISMAIGRANYGRLLLWYIVATLLLFVSLIMTAGLAVLILSPAMLLMTAHMYRQGSTGMIPESV